ncbi:hypothetical protein [Tsukamurella pseudospumae]|uniref:Uncharacterized protein n=1 Tax=Tsukamurella pseudospumae TaxID=239498 RepID=A0A138A0C5_9ACTN|nr:hypothetical protein [Tsukamurella pseudospumae]KXO89038.1 hypothetical protein AXK61_10430 [Tsukamurella pseudospumae]KXP03849.1 hypothetical protein AXK60_18960 [Tsukamurella pseudospumae]
MEVTDDIGTTLAAFTTGPLIAVATAWFFSAVIAGVIAEIRGRSGFGFFFTTLFFLGPLGPGFALVAPREDRGRPVAPRPGTVDVRPVMEGRRRFTCPRCGAANDIPEAHTSYDCWRCDEHRKVRPA